MEIGRRGKKENREREETKKIGKGEKESECRQMTKREKKMEIGKG